MKTFKKILITVLFVSVLGSSFIFTHSAFACSCGMATGEQDWTLKDYPGSVFTGKVQNTPETSNGNGNGKKAVTFEVIDGFKNVTGKTITIYTSGNEAACGYNFESNTEYLVYASPIEGQLDSGLCSGNKLVSDASYDIEHLQAARHTVIPGVQNKTLVPYVVAAMGVIVVVIILLILSLIDFHGKKMK